MKLRCPATRQGCLKSLRPDGGKMQQLQGVPSAFTPYHAHEEFYDMASKLYKASR
jgi:hypothetical protein